MYVDGYPNQTNIDISATVIKQMSEKYKEEIPDLKCIFYMPFCIVEVMDARNLKYPPGSFDVVLDKGTLDCILVCFWQLIRKSVGIFHQITHEKCLMEFIKL